MQALKDKTISFFFFLALTQEQKALIIKCLFNSLIVWLIKVTSHEVSEYLYFQKVDYTPNKHC